MPHRADTNGHIKGAVVGRVQRWAPVTGILFTVLAVVAFLSAGSSPDTSGKSGTNAKIATYLAKTSSYHHNFVAIVLLLVAGLLLLCFFAALRTRLVAAGDFGGHASLTFGAGVASVVLLLVSTALFVAPLAAAHDARPQPIDPNFYRLTQDTGYLLWVAAGAVGAIAIFAATGAVFSGALFPRWFGWVGVVFGVLSLASFLFITVLAYWLWILIAAILLLVRNPATAATTVTPAPTL